MTTVTLTSTRTVTSIGGTGTTAVVPGSVTLGYASSGSAQVEAVDMTGTNDVLSNYGALRGQSGVKIEAASSGVSVTNHSGGVIYGGGVDFAPALAAYAYFTLVNDGLITQALGSNLAVLVQAGARITNLGSGVISATTNAIYGHAGGAEPTYVLNYGSLLTQGTLYGAVGLDSGGTVVNKAGGFISAPSATYGVNISGGAGTVINAGTINDGITLASGYSDKLVVDPGAVFTGTVNGGAGVLELASGASTGTLNASTTTFTNFTSTTLASGSTWLIKGGSGLASGLGTITGFGTTDSIQITAHDSIVSTSSSAGVTHVTLGGGASMTLNFAGSLTLPLAASYSGGITTLQEAAAGPTLSTGGTVTFTGGGAAVTLDSAAIVSDSNSITGATVAISGFVAGDQLNFTNQNGITGSFNAATGVLTLSGTASAANFQTALDSITFNESSSSIDPTNAGNHTTRTVNWTVVDANGSTSGTSGIVTKEASVLNYGTTIQENGIVAATETVSAGVMTLKNAGATTVGSITVGASLSTGEFLLSNDGTNSTLVLDTVFGTYTSGVTLLTNPTTIASTGKVSNATASGNAISGPSGTNWTVTNLGTVAETGTTTPIGISLAASGTVINAGSIGATTSAGSGVGVSLAAGGAVTNQSGGAISGPFGVQVAAAAGTVINAGTISGTTTVSSRAGVRLSGGGSVTNQSGGTISGFYGVWGQTTAISVVNQGVIIGNLGSSLGVGVYLAEGGTLTNAATASITGANAVYVNGTVAGTIQNAGTITGNTTNTKNAGVYLRASASSLTNQSGGTITGFRGAIAIASTVVNAGSIGGNTTSASGAGVVLTTAGVLTNQSGGTVTGFLGVYNKSGAATVVNAGVIAGDASTGKGISFKGAGTVTAQTGGTISGGADAVLFAAGVTNRLVDDPGAVFTGIVNGGNTIGAASISTLELASAATTGTLTSLGSQFINFAQVLVDTHAQWALAGYNTAAHGVTLTDNGTLTVIGTLVNAGLIAGDYSAIAVGAGGQLTNQSGGTITNANPLGIIVTGAGTVVNAGLVQVGTSGGQKAISFGAGGVVTNQSGGTIIGNTAIYAESAAATVVNYGAVLSPASVTSGNGIVLDAGGLVSNASGGSITGYTGIYISGGAGTVINAGGIVADTLADAYGVKLGDGGSVTNLSSGTITGDDGVTAIGTATVTNLGSIGGNGNYGINLEAGGTVVNAGRVSGAADSVYLGVSHTNRLVVDPGAVFVGTVNGGNTFGAASISTLELASGASAGTLNGLGGKYIDFAQITIDSGAQWNVIGNDSTTALGGATLTGFTYGDTIDVTNFVATSSAFSSNHLTLTSGASTISIDIVGSFVTSQFDIISDGSTGSDIVLQPPVRHYGDTIDEAGIVAASETVNAGVMTLFNAGNTQVGTVQVGTTLNTSDFILQSDGAGGTDVIVNTVFGTYTSGVTLLVNPTTIASTAKAASTVVSGAAVSGPTGTAWTLVNQGTISESSALGFGVSFAASGTVTNASTGTITANIGVYDTAAAATVVNAGRILSSLTSPAGVKLGGGAVTNQSGGTITGAEAIWGFSTALSVVNSGSINGSATAGSGIFLTAGGTVTNQSGGTITGQHGIYTETITATAINAGIIRGNTTAGAGVRFNAGGAVTNQSGGTITGLRGVYMSGATAGTVVNTGSIGGAGSDPGIQLAAGGSITNNSGGTITGYQGIFANTDPATVINGGDIGGDSLHGEGIYLSAGGTVTNLSTGTITGNYAIALQGGPGTLVNAGTITGYIGSTSVGSAAGFYGNGGGQVTNQSGGVITGFFAVSERQAALTVVNAGSLGGNATVSGAAGAYLGAGGAVTNQSGGTITGYYGVRATGAAAIVVNAGVIAGNYSSNYNNADGVYLQAGGSVTNQAGGAIYGRNDGVQIAGARGTVVNLGSIHSRINATYGGRGVSLAEGGLIVNGTTGGTASTAFIGGYNYAIQFGTAGTDTLMNYGTVNGEPGTVAVSMYTGTLINGASGATGALIEGGEQASAVLISGAGTVINDATITSYTPHYATKIGFGVSLGGGGTISNLGSLALIEAYVPVYAGQGATVINAGTIESHYGPGTGAFAVVFGGGTNRLIIDPGAVFVGTVHGSGPVTASVAQYPGATSFTTTTLASAVGTATLELASGASAGTLSGLGTKYVGFSAVTVDSGAQWTFAGSNTLAAGVTLTNSGTDTVAGTLVNDGRVTGANNGIAVGATGQLTNSSGGTITATNTAVVLAGGLVSNASGGVIDGAFGIYDKAGAGAGSVVNAGRINATSGDGIVLDAGGAVTNQSGGTIGATGSVAGGAAIFGGGAAVTVDNAGVIDAQGTYSGVKLDDGGLVINHSGATIVAKFGVVLGGAAATVINSGSVSSGNIGVEVTDGGIVSNASGGTIAGDIAILGVVHAATVVNAGSLRGQAAGISLNAGGTVTNQAGGTISGSSNAVLFAASYTSRLVIDPGAVFYGTVDGGNTIGATHVSTLELASGASTGTLNGFGSQYIDFEQITIDSGAQWDIIGNDAASALAGATISGFSYGDTIDVTNFVATSSSFSGNHLTLTSGASTISIDITGNFITQQFRITNDGSTGTDIILQSPTLHYGDTIDEAGIVATSETVNAGVMTLFNSGHTAVGTVGVGTTLNSGDFLVSNNGTNSTLVLDTVFGTYTSGVTLLTNPTTIASTAKITGSLASTTGVSGPSGTAWTLTNLGTVSETGTASFGVSLASGGTITNATAALISAGTAGVYINGGAGSVSNAGSIAGSANFGIRFGSTSTGGTVSNQSGGVITGASDAVYFNTGSGAGTVSNAGTIAGGTSGFGGINLSGGGLVSNASGGTITGHAAGVFVAVATGTVSNAGSIGATVYGVWLENGGTVTNMSGGVVTGSYGASSAAGVYFSAGGAVTNQSGGTIAGLRGVYVEGGAATVVNAGHIVGSNTTIGAGAASTGAGLYLGAGGSVTNQSGGMISGFDGVYASNTAVTVVNAGSIGGNTASGVAIKLTHGGSVTNQSGGTITGASAVYDNTVAATVVNAGSIGGGTAGGAGVFLKAGGAVTNQSGGRISGYYAVSASAVATVSNVGTITGVGSYAAGVRLNAGGLVTNQSGGTVSGANGVVGGAAAFTVINSGSIAGSQAAYSGDAGVGLFGGGTLTNLSGGVITGNYAVNATTAPATISNAGIISGIIGVEANAAAQVTNRSGGTITGSHLGVQVVNHVGTVVNAGSIGGTSYYGVQLSNGGTITNQSGGTISGGVNSVRFGAGATNRLVIDPGAVFSGLVDGGNTIGAASISTLELASGAGAGTLTGLGSQFINFAHETIDASANWTFSGANTVVAGATLTNSGALTDNGTLINAGTISGNLLNLSGGALTNQASGQITAAYVYGVSGGGTDTVLNQGTIRNTSNIAVYLNTAGNVTNTTGALISGSGTGVKLHGANATVSNAGLITATSTVGSYGIYMRNGGLVTNGTATGSTTSTASIQGYYGAAFKSVDALNEYGTLANYGTVRGTGTAAGDGVLLSNGGTVFNGQSGATAALISGYRYGVSSQIGSVSNDATIIATGTQSGDYGVDIQGTGSIGNLGSAALIEGYVGALVELNGTITNGGTIESNQGTSGTAIKFTGGNARLIEQPTATLIGGVYGGSGGTAVLELASGASAGTISGLGTSITNFTSLVFDAGAAWTVKGNDSANGLGTLGIAGFAKGDTIDLTGFVATNRTFSSGTLVVGDGIGDYETLHIAGTFTTANVLIRNDGSGGTDISLISPPSVTAGATVTFTGGGSPVTLDSGLTVTLNEGSMVAGATIDINSGFVSGDQLNFTNTGSITGSFNSATGVLTLSGTDTAADYQAALESITFSVSPSNGDPTAGGSDLSRTIDWIVNDGTGTNSAVSSTVDVVHVAPTVTSGGTVTFTGGGSAVTLDSTLSVTDVDSGGNLTGATISVGGFISGDLLNFTTQNGITGSYNSASGVLTLSGTATVADYQAALDSITYSFNPANGDPTGGGSHTSRTIDWVVSDGSTSNGVSNTGTSTLTEVHVAPSITSGGTVTFTGGGAAVTLDSTLTLADVDSGGTLTGATISIGGFLSGDLLNFTTQNGITGSYNASTGVLTLSGTATVANYQAALDSITYSVTPANDDPTGGGTHTSRTIDWVVTDGNTANGISNTGSSTLAAVHVAPTLTAGGTVTFNGGGSAVTLDSTLTVGDVDSNGTLAGATISIGGFTSGDQLNFTTQNGITGSYNSTSGVLTLSGTATVANYQTALDSITFSFSPSNADPTAGNTDTSRTVSWTVNDGDTANNLSNTGTSTVTVVHTAPTIATGGTVTFSGGGSAVVLDSKIGITVPDSSNNISGATISIGAGFLSGDTLNFSNELGITGSYNASTGVLTLSGTTTAANYVAALDSVTFSETPSNTDPTAGGTDLTRSISWVVNDGVSLSAAGTTTLDLVHVAPSVTAGGTVTFTGGGSAVTLDSALAVGDVDSNGTLATATISIGNFVSGDVLNFVNQGGITGSYNAATGTLTLNGTASIANYQSALDSITFSFSPSNGDPTNYGSTLSQTISWSVSDGSTSNGVSNTGSSTLDLVHVAPTITAGDTVTYVALGTPVALDGTVSVSDVDSFGTLTGATVIIQGDTTGDTLNFTNELGITGSFAAATGTLTLTGDASIANYQSALASITFSSSLSDPTFNHTDSTRAVTWQVSDGSTSNGVSNATTTTVDIVLGPSITAGGTATFIGGGSPAVLDSGLTVSDPVSTTLAGATIWVGTGFQAGDVLNFSSEFGITGSYNATTGTLTLAGTTTLANYQSALDSVTFSVSPSDDDPTVGGTDTTRTIDWVANDGSHASLPATSTLDLVHTAPTVTAGGNAIFNAPSAVALDPTISVIDVDSNGTLSGATISIGAGFISGEDALNFTTQNGITGSYNSGTGVLTLTGTASLANYQSALASVTFSDSLADPSEGATDNTRTISWVITDGNASNSTSTSSSSTVTVNGPPPVVSGISGNVVDFIAQGAPVVADSSVSLTDGDSTTLTGATVWIAGGFLNGDSLAADTSGTPIIESYNPATGTLTLTGTASLADYELVLDRLTYASSAADPSVGSSDLTRLIAWQVNDGRSGNNLSQVQDSTVDVHVLPTISAGGTVTFTPGGGAVLVDSTATLTDVDTNPVSSGTVAITTLFRSGDVLAFNNGTDVESFGDGATITGSYNAATGVLTLTTSAGTASTADYQTALDSVTFNNATNAPDNDGRAPVRVLTWTVNTGLAGQTSDSVTTEVRLTHLAPTLTASGTITYHTGGAAVTLDSGLTVTDIDSGGILTGATVTIAGGFLNGDTLAFTNQNGITGSYISSAGVLVLSGTASIANYQAALDSIGFSSSPVGGDPTQGGTDPSRSITWVVTDGSPTNGVSNTGTTTVSVAAASPVLGGTLANAGVPNETASTPFSGLTVTDTNTGQTDTVTITLSNPAYGAFTNLDGGSYNSGTGVYTVAGSASAVTTAIDDLVLTPNAPASGVYVTSTNVTVAVSGTGGGATPETAIEAAVQQVLGLATVSGSSLAISVSPDGSSFANPVNGKTNEAVITSPGTSVTYALPTGYQAEFLGGSTADSLTDTVVGGAVLVGNSGNDTITASAANDSLVGGNGNNLIIGGPGTIALVAGSGNNTVTGPSGSTYAISLGNGNDTVFADGSGTITGGTGANVFDIESGGGTNRVNSDGADVIYTGGTLTNVSVAGSGADVVGGTSGTVDVTVTGAAASLSGGGATVAVTTSGGTGYYYGGSAGLNLTDNGSGDTILGTGGPLVINATTNPLIYAESSALTLTGGAGTPTVIGGNAGASIAGGAGGVVMADGTGTPTVSGAATLFGAAGGLADYLGSTGGLLFYAEGGAETVNASSSSANHVMIGTASNSGSDLFITGTGSDTVAAVAGSVTVNATASPLVYGGAGFLQVNGGAGTPTVIGGSGSASIVAGSGGVDVAGENGTPTISGAATMFGGAGGDMTYVGSVGGALWVGEGGAETLNAAGSSTSNTIYANSVNGSSQVIIGGSGTDTIIGGTGATTVEATTGTDVAAGSSGALTFIGGTQTSTVYGSSGTVSVQGGSGGVIFVGETGTASLSGAVTAYGAAGELLDYTGSTGGLTFNASSGSETLNAAGSSTANMLLAGANQNSRDVLTGGSGNDTLVAGAGADTLTGGAGSNEFLFVTGRDGGTVTVTDFTGSDAVQLLGYGAGAASSALAGAQSSGGNTTLTLSDNTQITFLGVASVSTLQGHVFSS